MWPSSSSGAEPPGDPPTETPPAAPTGLAVTGVGSNQVTLTWADNSDNEDGFRISTPPTGSPWRGSPPPGPARRGSSPPASTPGPRITSASAPTTAAATPHRADVVQATTPGIPYEVVFSDNFEDNAIDLTRWSLVNGTWSESGGVMRQSGTAFADEKKALVRSSEGAAQVHGPRPRRQLGQNGEYATSRRDPARQVQPGLHRAQGGPGPRRVRPRRRRLERLGARRPQGPGRRRRATRRSPGPPGLWYLFDMRIEEGILSSGM